jgi:hypothetical protein
VHDPLEGLDDDGRIRTGVSIDRVPVAFAPVVDDAAAGLRHVDRSATLLLYGSVATGRATVPTSDVDLIALGVSAAAAASLSRELTTRFADRCRGVEIGVVRPDDLVGDRDEAYGNRVFLHHYCVHLSGPEPDRTAGPFPGDVRAARGFNGDIARHARRWRQQVGSVAAPDLARRVGRKSLLAVAGLVSVHDATWTTDRARASRRWAEVEPYLADGLATLLAWAETHPAPDAHDDEVAAVLDGPVARIVAAFDARIGLWP